MVCRSTVIALGLVMLLSFQPKTVAQCRSGQQVLDGQPRNAYRRSLKQGMLTNAQWDKGLELGRASFSMPYFSGFLESDYIQGWKLVEVTDVRGLEAIIVAIRPNGRDGHRFYADYTYIPKRDLLQERVRKADLSFYNNMLRAERVSINSPAEALDLSLLFLRASTHRARGFFVELINSPSDIPEPNDDKRRFGGIVEDPVDESLQSDFQKKIEQLSKIVTPPRYSEHGDKYDVSFFTWDSALGDVEQWCFTVSKSEIVSFTRKLVVHKV